MLNHIASSLLRVKSERPVRKSHFLGGTGGRSPRVDGSMVEIGWAKSGTRLGDSGHNNHIRGRLLEKGLSWKKAELGEPLFSLTSLLLLYLSCFILTPTFVLPCSLVPFCPFLFVSLLVIGSGQGLLPRPVLFVSALFHLRIPTTLIIVSLLR